MKEVTIKDPETVASCIYSLLMYGGAMANFNNVEEGEVPQALVSQAGTTIVRCVGTLIDALGSDELSGIFNHAHSDLNNLSEVVRDVLAELDAEAEE